MAEGLNKVMLIGNLGRAPELRYTGSNTPVMTLNLATNTRQKIRDEWTDQTEWHNVVVWGNRAEGLNKILQKGTHLFIEGKLQTRDWKDKDGNKRYTTEVVAREVLLLSKKGAGNGGYDHAPPPDDSDYSGGYSNSNQDSNSSDNSHFAHDDSDLPF